MVAKGEPIACAVPSFELISSIGEVDRLLSPASAITRSKVLIDGNIIRDDEVARTGDATRGVR